MPLGRPKISLTLLLSALLMTACSTTRPVGEWRSPDFTGQVDNILVIGVTSRSTRRRVFEDSFVAALASRGIKAVPSYTLITSSMKLSRETVEQAVRQQGLGAVLVTRVAGVVEEETYRLPANYDYERGYFGYYDHAWQQTSQGYYASNKVFALETHLYDAASDRLIWTMQSETMDATRPRHVIEDQIELTIKNLSKQGLIANKP